MFPPDLTGYHDGAQVPLARGLDLVRAMLRDNGAWCRLEVEGSFFLHVGYDQYLYVGSVEPGERAVAVTRSLGLFPERIDVSPYDPCFAEPCEQRPADDAFWDEVSQLSARRGTVLLEEGYLANASRWHRLRPANINEVRAALTPRAWLHVWPDRAARLPAARAPMAIPLDDESRPLLASVLPDSDGVVRARWA